MKEVLKFFNECVFSTRHDKKERLDKIDNILIILYSEFEKRRHKINIKLF